MADILIRGMDKPGSCHECDFCEIQDINFELLYYCNRTKRFIDEEEACNIPSDCPLHELPEHGDLIDRDVLYKLMETYSDYGGATEPHDENMIHRDSILFAIENAPAIAQANKEPSKEETE